MIDGSRGLVSRKRQRFITVCDTLSEVQRNGTHDSVKIQATATPATQQATLEDLPENETYTGNKYKEPNGDLCCHPSLYSMQTSIQPSSVNTSLVICNIVVDRNGGFLRWKADFPFFYRKIIKTGSRVPCGHLYVRLLVYNQCVYLSYEHLKALLSLRGPLPQDSEYLRNGGGGVRQ